MKPAGFGERFEFAFRFEEADMHGHVIARRMQYDSSGGPIFRRWVEVRFEQIAAETAVYQVIVAVVASGDYRHIVVDGQVTSRVSLGYAAIAAGCPPARTHKIVLRMGHGNYSSAPRSCRACGARAPSRVVISASSCWRRSSNRRRSASRSRNSARACRASESDAKTSRLSSSRREAS